MNNMSNATIFWRADGDDFIVTVVDFVEDENNDPLDYISRDWIEMAVLEEGRMSGYTEDEMQEELEETLKSYELLAVIKGKVEYYY